MSWSIVPLLTRDLDYFDRQRDLYSKWMHLFDDDWRAMRFDDSVSRFDRELDRIRREMHDLDAEVPELQVAQPFVTDPEGNRKLSLRFNCDKFKPEEITVKTTGNVLNVHAKHEEDRPGKKVHMEFTRNYTLPKNVDPNSLKSTLSKDGVLQIEAPAPPAVEAPKENLIPIERL